MKKVIFFIVTLLIMPIFGAIPRTVFAEKDFTIDSLVLYDFDSTGKTDVVHTITLSNNNSSVYAKDFTLNLTNIEPFDIEAHDSSGSLDVQVTPEEDLTKVNVSFNEPTVGEGNTQVFSISYLSNDFATKTGEVWEISIPKLNNNELYRSYTTELKIPSEFGKEAYVSPNPTSKTQETDGNIYSFDKSSSTESSISLGFGNFQVFSFILNYHLENPLKVRATTEIPIPPDTPFQKVFYTDISPKPQNIYVDTDGNWIAEFDLDGRERIDVKATGAVQIFASPTLINLNKNPNFNGSYTQSTEFWQVDDPLVQSISGSLNTARSIYDYLIGNFDYNIDRAKPNVKRLGAKDALINPKNAICMEFTDAFIALSRANGIPAREINGFAYSENPDIQPLSLVSDVLHSWPEYWDSNKNSWVPVDPTWGSTSGVDYFDKLDLRHFAFVIHGVNDSNPFPPGSYKLGPNPQKDVYVNFGKLPEEKITKPEIVIEISSAVPLVSSKALVAIKNPGPVALYNTNVIVLFDERIHEEFSIESLLPYQSREFEVKIPFSLLGRNTPEKIVVLAASVKSEADSEKQLVIIFNLIVISLLSILIVGGAFWIVRKGLAKKHAKDIQKENSLPEEQA